MVKVYDTVSKQTLIFPMLPEKITFEAGATFLSYDLMNIGEVKMPSGETASTISFDGVLPSEKRKKASYVSNWRPPKEIQELFSMWRNGKRKLRLTIDGTPINHGVYLENYKVDYAGGLGDYEYSISFVVAKDITAETTTNKTMTYVTVQGDSWWTVAQKTTGSGSNYISVKTKPEALAKGVCVKCLKRKVEKGKTQCSVCLTAIPTSTLGTGVALQVSARQKAIDAAAKRIESQRKSVIYSKQPVTNTKPLNNKVNVAAKD